jgi:mRNA interferase RelE/StbE
MARRARRLEVTYEVYIEAEVHNDRARLPGNMRQRLRREIENLGEHPAPPGSQTLDAKMLDIPAGVEMRRLRIASWRLVYAVSHAERWVWVLAMRRRPPYDYADLPELIDRLR